MREARLGKDKAMEGKLYVLFMSRCEARLKRAIPMVAGRTPPTSAMR